MITLANIRRAVYYLNKRIDLLEKNGGTGGGGDSQELRNRITALESIISEGENPTAAIDKFNEIVAFLNTINNTDTLSGLLLDIVSLIPSAQIQADWDLSDNTLLDFIKNKPTIPAKISNLQDDSNFLLIPDNQNVFVDMGLPSGTLWATCDIDVTKPNGFCDTPFVYEKSFFSWGNIDGHNPISNSAFDYNWGGVNQAEPWYEGQPYGSTKGNTLTGNIAVGEDFDAARANLGAPWRMPTNGEYGELFANIIYINADGTEVSTTKTDKRVTVNGIVGLYIQSKINGARLFFSCSGYGNGSSWNNRGSYGIYWSSSFDSSRLARNLYFDGGGVHPQDGSLRYDGFAVRAVLNPSSLKASKVAITGDYNDLSNKPTIPNALIQSDWNQTDNTAKDFIKNKPTIPVAQEVPSKLSNLLNDKNFLESPKYDYVEIGGIKWATMNIGANSETDGGLYFQWGDVEGYSSSLVGSGNDLKSFSWVDYKYGNGTSSPGASGMSKYNSTDGKTTLEDTDDASKVILKGSWRLPTLEEFLTLISSTTRSWKSNYNSTGVKGTLLTSKADSNIKLFFPIGGFALDNNINSSNADGFYWSSTLSGGKNEGRSLCLNSGNFLMDGLTRNRGHFIRAVLDESSSNLLSKVALTGSYNDLSNKPDVYTKSEADGKFVATHDYVEIGGIKWATMNVGANSITDAGLYFLWGDILGYTSSQLGSSNGKWNGYKYCSSGNSSNLDKYNSTDGKTKLDSSDDAVKAIWGNGWRMPTAEEYTILRDAVNTTWTSDYQGSGVRGRILTDKTDNSKTLFFPAVGEFYDGSLLGNKSRGRYWSTNLYTSDKRKAICFSFDSSGITWGFDNWRCSNQTIRAVYDENISYNDLKDKPTIPEKNSNLENDSNFLRNSTILDYVEIAGIKWATMNLGANSVADYGSYFQWGDTQGYTADQVGSGEGKKYFGYNDYILNTPNDWAKYNSTDKKKTLDSVDDAATSSWKGGWRIPTSDEFNSLKNATNRTWTDDYLNSGIAGLIFTDKRDSSKVLFFPANGNADSGVMYQVDTMGYYWTNKLSTSTTDKAKYLEFNSNSASVKEDIRVYGFSIRCILDGEPYNIASKVAITGDYNDLSNKPTIPTVPSSETAASGGSTLSLVTTGEKYNWNNKANIWRGTLAEYDLLTPDDNTIYIIIPAS